MAEQLTPIQELDKVGLIADTPAHSLPPNAWSDCNNVIFADGSVKKRMGAEQVFSNLTFTPTFHIFWPAPNTASGDNRECYVIADDAGRLYTLRTDQTAPVRLGTTTYETDSEWQGTLFNGGYNLILNNGQRDPIAISIDSDGDYDVAVLPGWNYNDNFNVTCGVIKSFGNTLVAGNLSINNAGTTTPDPDITIASVSNGDFSIASIGWVESGEIIYINLNISDVPTRGRVVTFAYPNVTLDSSNTVEITNWSDSVLVPNVNRLIRATTTTGQDVRSVSLTDAEGREWLFTRSGTGTTVSSGIERFDVVVRRSYTASAARSNPGSIRVSTVAPPGGLPATWEPGLLGDKDTADEFELSSTSPIQDIVELRSAAIIYTQDSFHSLQVSGTNPNTVANLSDSYGALSEGCVAEFDGNHVVVGSDDIYVHNGNPTSIKSISDGRVRDLFWDNLNRAEDETVKVVGDRRNDEIRFYQPTGTNTANNRYLAWNYRHNTWSRNDANNAISVTVGPISSTNNSRYVIELDNDGDQLLATDRTYQFDGTNYTSFAERTHNGFEQRVDFKKRVSEFYPQATGDFTVSMSSVDNPNATVSFPTRGKQRQSFDAETEYKVDMNTEGRYLNFRFEDTSSAEWTLSSYHLNLDLRGRR